MSCEGSDPFHGHAVDVFTVNKNLLFCAYSDIACVETRCLIIGRVVERANRGEVQLIAG